MKFYTQKPQREIRIVKPDRGAKEYEFYVLIPVFVGSARALGTQQVVTEDNIRFPNMQSAAMYCIDKYDTKAPKIQQAKQEQKRVSVSGMTIVAQGKWAEFCGMRKLDVSAPEHVTHSYSLTPEEVAALDIHLPRGT